MEVDEIARWVLRNVKFLMSLQYISSTLPSLGNRGFRFERSLVAVVTEMLQCKHPMMRLAPLWQSQDPGALLCNAGERLPDSDRCVQPTSTDGSDSDLASNIRTDLPKRTSSDSTGKSGVSSASTFHYLSLLLPAGSVPCIDYKHIAMAIVTLNEHHPKAR